MLRTTPDFPSIVWDCLSPVLGQIGEQENWASYLDRFILLTALKSQFLTLQFFWPAKNASSEDVKTDFAKKAFPITSLLNMQIKVHGGS